MTDKFKQDYLVMDEFGKKELRCMASGKIVGSRIERESKRFRGKTTMEFMRHSDYCEMPFLMKDGSIAFLIFCEDYKNADVGEEELKRINEQLRRAKRIELKSHGKTDDFIENIMQKFNEKEVISRMSIEEFRKRVPRYQI